MFSCGEIFLVNVMISALQTVPVLVALSVLVLTALWFLMRGSAAGRRPPVTLQDPTVKYPLCLIEKQVLFNHPLSQISNNPIAEKMEMLV